MPCWRGAIVFMGECINMKKMSLKVEDLEERIAPSFVFAEGSKPFEAGANPTGGQGGPVESFGPNSGSHPNSSPWGVHQDQSGFSPNQGQAHLHTPLDFGEDA